MDAFLATILPTGFNYNPVGWLGCNGQQLPVGQNEAVFALIGQVYGGDGKTNFKLPDLRGRVPIGWGEMPGGLFAYNIGEKSGNDVRTIQQSQIPPHIHTATFVPTKTSVIAKTAAVTGNQSVIAKFEASTGPGADPGPKANGFLAASASASVKVYSATSTAPVALGGVSASLSGSPSIPALDLTIPDVVNGGAITVTATGGGQPIDIRPSSLAINFIFCMSGVWPSRA